MSSRSYMFKVRLSSFEMNMLRDHARVKGVSMSTAFRILLLGEAWFELPNGRWKKAKSGASAKRKAAT